jgi:hypothetical protein
VTTPGMAAYLSSRILTITRDGGLAADAARVADEIRRWRVHQLLGSERPDSARERVEVLCRRAALASVAVFTGLPYADAVLAAEALAVRFIAIEFPPSQGREIFIPWRGRLLSEPDIVIERSDNQLRWGATPTQQLRFADRDFHAAVLEEIWEHYDAARSPLLLWLRELAVSSADEAVRIRAAQVIGRLATRDFGHVCHRVLLDLSGSVNRRAREAAAIALEAIAEIMAQLVWNLLTEWCQDGNQHRQHTAVLALGTGIGEHDPGATLAQLRSLAIRNTGRGTHSMAEAVRRSVIGLFSGPHPAAVIRALRQWAVDPDPRLHAVACRSVPPLAHVPGSSRRPLLLAVLADQPRLRADAVTLIAAALDDARTRQEAWTALENLAVAAADDARLTDTVGELLRDLQRVSATAEHQIHFYLLVWACRHQALTHPTEASTGEPEYARR